MTTKPTVMVSGGFDPIHIGHVRMIQEAARYGDVIVALNSDEWLRRKKGFVFMPWEERSEILQAFNEVWEIAQVNDEDGTVRTSLALYMPNYFANGGDRGSGNTPEVKLCQELGIKTIFGIGGGKIQSSSKLTQSNYRFEKRPWGAFILLSQGADYWIKVLSIEPGQSISLQYHEHRSEVWVCLQGTGAVQVHTGPNEDHIVCTVMHQKDTYEIRPMQLHRVTNIGDMPLLISEVAIGKPDEDDIVRLQDQYGRTEDA